MNTEERIARAEERLSGIAERFERPESNRLDAYLPADRLLEAVAKILVKPEPPYLSAITGLDQPNLEDPQAGQIEVLYTFCDGAAIISLRMSVPYSQPVIPTLCGIIPSATLYEREMIEMFGLVFPDTPNTDRLLLPDDWPDGVFPLRKSFTGLEALTKE